MKQITFLALILFQTTLASASGTAGTLQPESPLRRTYLLGDSIQYVMSGTNQAGSEIQRYSVNIHSEVRKDQSGVFFETAGFSNFYFNDKPVTLNSVSSSFRQQVSLDPIFDPTKHLPQQAGIDDGLRAPSDDLMNLYVDLQLAAKLPMLRKAGDRFYLKYGVPVTYLNGQAQTCVDFDVTLRELNEQTGIAVLEVKHVPPQIACVSLPAPWMQIPVAGGLPNNVVQTIQTKGGHFVITVGTETIDVEIHVQLGSGKILKATLNDRFQLIDRTCVDSLGTKCGAPKSYNQLREVSLVPL